MTDTATCAGRASGILRISDFVAMHAERSPTADALVLDERRINYAELHQRVDSVARALLAAGVRKGDRVATLSTPHPDYFITFLASASIGAIWLGLNPRYRTEELKYVVSDAEPTLLFARICIDGRNYADEVAAMRAAASSIRRVVALDTGDLASMVEALPAFVAGGVTVADAALGAARAGCGGRDPCLLVYTSGSTGRPKGALLHHEALVEASLGQNRAWPVTEVRFLNYFPINHVGCVVDVSCPTLAAGGCIVFMEQFSPGGALERMQRERVTVWASVPSTFQMQLALPDFDRYDLSAVELIVWEGAAMPSPIIRRLREVVPRLATNYSMTESTGAITIVQPTGDLDVLSDTVGALFPGVEVRLVGPDGQQVARGEAGEVQTRSICNMLGYWRRPGETAEVLSPEGWLRTGDLAIERSDGRYRIVGRLKEMFKSGGYNIYPREVEDVIELHPAVAMAAVVNRPDELWQEVGVAFVLAREAVGAEELERHCRRHLANYKIPKEFVLCEELPLLPIGKVDKVALRQRAANRTG